MKFSFFIINKKNISICKTFQLFRDIQFNRVCKANIVVEGFVLLFFYLVAAIDKRAAVQWGEIVCYLMTKKKSGAINACVSVVKS